MPKLSSAENQVESGKFSERLDLALAGRSVLSFSKECGISDSLLRKYLASSLPGTDNLVAIARAAKVSIAWLAAGEGPMRLTEEAESSDTNVYAYIPLFDARCSAGGGAWNENVEVLAQLAFTRYSLQKRVYARVI